MNADTTLFWRRTLTAARRAFGLLIAAPWRCRISPRLCLPRRRGGLPVIRDAEIEQLLREYTAPILRAAGLAKQNVRIVLINDRTYNAFVVDGRRIFVNAGALIESQTPNQIIGVLAHETGHIAGGHLAKIRQEMANVQSAMLLAMLLGLGAAVAGARSGDAAAAARDGAATDRYAVAAVLSASAGRTGRPRRREISRGDRPEREGHVRNLQAVWRPDHVFGAVRRSLHAVPSDAARARGIARRNWSPTVRTGTRRIRPNRRCATN